MAVRDIFSNYNPTLIDNRLVVPNGGVTTKTGAFDLSAGETTLVTYHLIGIDLTVPTIEFSEDAAFTNPVVNTDPDNKIVDADTGAVIDGTETAPLSAVLCWNCSIVNPPAVIESGDLLEASPSATLKRYRYARLSLVHNGAGTEPALFSIQKTGPQRYVAAE